VTVEDNLVDEEAGPVDLQTSAGGISTSHLTLSTISVRSSEHEVF
jgi:hypothetical protein